MMEIIRIEAIDDIEKCLFQGDTRKALRILIEILIHIEQHKAITTSYVIDAEEPMLTSIYTRLIAILQQILTQEKMNIPLEDYFNFILLARACAVVFESSGFYVADHLLRYFRKKIGDVSRENYVITEKVREHLKRYLLCSVFAVKEIVDYRPFFKLCPELALPAYLAVLSYNVVLTPHLFERREQLLDYKNLPTKTPLPIFCVDLTTAAYMMCSYAVRRDKHLIKIELNAIIRHIIHSQGVFSSEFLLKRKMRERPVIVIVIEMFNSSHAMYRCFCTAIQELRDRFELVSLSLISSLDDKAKELFDSNIEILSERKDLDINDLKYAVAKIREQAPDIIYYPSIGMRALSVALSTLRLAPIQTMTMGAPATTYCEYIDYVFMEEDNCTRSTDLCSEKMIVLPPDTFKALPLTHATHVVPNFRENPQPLAIAVPAKIYKLNPMMFEVCRKIKAKVKRPIIFHFFPNETQAFVQAKREILRILPGSYIYPPTDLSGYLQSLNDLDMYLATFPFSGANSFVDAASLGLPVITMRNEELHGVFEEVMINRLGLPTWLIANNVDEYVDAAIRIIEDNALRLSLGKLLMEKMQWFMNIMKGDEKLNDHNFSEAMWEVYLKHETLQKVDDRKFTLAQLKALQ